MLYSLTDKEREKRQFGWMLHFIAWWSHNPSTDALRKAFRLSIDRSCIYFTEFCAK